MYGSSKDFLDETRSPFPPRGRGFPHQISPPLLYTLSPVTANEEIEGLYFTSPLYSGRGPIHLKVYMAEGIIFNNRLLEYDLFSYGISMGSILNLGWGSASRLWI
jgi:hypothetical protein